MVERKGIAKTPREHFTRAVEDELEKFVRKEIAFQQADRIERGLKLGLSGPGAARAPKRDQARD